MTELSPGLAAQRALIAEAEPSERDERIVARLLFEYENDRQAPEERYDWDRLADWQRAAWVLEARDLLGKVPWLSGALILDEDDGMETAPDTPPLRCLLGFHKLTGRAGFQRCIRPGCEHRR